MSRTSYKARAQTAIAFAVLVACTRGGADKPWLLVDHDYAGSNGNMHPPVHEFAYRLPGGLVDVEVRSGGRLDTTRLDVITGRRWIVVQNYGPGPLGISVEPWSERPLWG